MGMPSGIELLIMGMMFFIVISVVTIIFLVSQHAFAKSMQTSVYMKNTNPGWIWTQLIPIWSFVAIPVTLLKLNEQFKQYVTENNFTANEHLKYYSNVWGWIWYGGTVLGMFVPFFYIISIVGLIGFWIHIMDVKKSLEYIKVLEK